MINKSIKAFNRFVFCLSWFLKPINLAMRFSRYFRGGGRRILAYLVGTEISEVEFQKSLLPEYARRQDFLEHFKEQQSRFFFVKTERKHELITSLRQVCPDAEENIIKSANTVCEHYFDLLGSGPVNLGWPIDWHCDFKTGFRWNPGQYYTDVRPAPYPGGYDLKVPWELSRCQHFIWLGQAYWLTGDEKYSHEFRAEVEDWIKQNQPEFGVNWACSMDIAIRAVNWLWGYGFFQDSPVLDDDFRITLCKSLLCHGRHIRSNLERTLTFSGNHYLSDIVGLIYLGILLPEFKESESWREFGLKELETEMFKQVYPDGGNFEASTSYHRLVTELFLSAMLLAQLNGYNFSEMFMERLEKMLEFIYQITKPDGTFPIIGDQDNGRLHRLKVWADPNREWKDFRPLLAIGSVLFKRLDWGKAAGDHWEEAIWFYGTDALVAYEKCTQNLLVQTQSVGFEDTGLYILHANDIYVAVDLGSIGQDGRGGHAHNDSLSFELFASGQTWIQDPGTYAYTPDYRARNLFRSTMFHNTLTFAEYEQNNFEPRSLFKLKNETNCRLLTWIVKQDLGVYLAGELHHIKYPRTTFIRSFYLDPVERVLVVTDSVSNVKAKCRFHLHFAPRLNVRVVEQPYQGIELTDAKKENVLVFAISPGIGQFHFFDGCVSEGYGLSETAKVAYFECSAGPTYKTAIMLPGDESRINSRLTNTLENEKLFL